ncbi:MAG: YcaO-like family protein [Deltaproteobacteria bacterium]|nr:YcaO-like family protein [Deltaproteobacteria bacterium]
MYNKSTGKDSSLKESISKLTNALNKRGFTIETLSVINPVADIWSVHIGDADCKRLTVNGKGVTKDAAVASALGEFHERLSCDYLFNEYMFLKDDSNLLFSHHPHERWFPLDSTKTLKDILPAKLANFYSPQNGHLLIENLVDFNTGNIEKGICTLPFKTASIKPSDENKEDRSQIFFPVSILNSLYASNGMAAGNSVYEARTQALCEILERYAKNKIISEMIAMPDIPKDIIELYENVTAGINELIQNGFEVFVKDASLNMGLPVVNITLANPNDGGVIAAFGAHPDMRIALERTLTELMQGRSMDLLTGLPVPAIEEDEVNNKINLEQHFVNSTGCVHLDFFKNTPDYSYSLETFHGDTEKQYEYLLSILNKMKKEVYVADFQHTGVYCCRIIVPEVSEIYPVDDLIENTTIGKFILRDAILNKSLEDNNNCRELLELIEEEDYYPYLKLSELTGIAFDDENNIAIGELNAILAIKTGDLEDAESLVAWMINSNILTGDKRVFFNCLSRVLSIKNSGNNLELYEKSLNKIFSKKTVSDVLKVINGDLTRTGWNFLISGESPKGHQNIMDAYKKCLDAKLKFHF